MDMIKFLRAKAARCRDLARLRGGDAARRLLEIAEDAEQDVARWQRRLREAVASGRRDRAARLPWRIRGGTASPSGQDAGTPRPGRARASRFRG
jgi:hypothetical protein